MRKISIMLALAFAAIAGPALTTTTVALASCTATIRVSNISITSSNVYNVKGTMNSCAASATWDMDGGGGYSQTVDGWVFDGAHTDYAYFYPGINPLGSYEAAGTGAFDSNFNPLPQANTYFAIKLGSRIIISGYRSGSYVYVRAYVTRFNPNVNFGLGGWVVSTGRYVSFYDHRTGGWHLDGHLATGRNGFTAYLRIHAPGQQYFRAHVNPTGSIWGATSGSVRH